MSCINGPVSVFMNTWPDFVRRALDPALVPEEREAESQKTPERLCHLVVLGVLLGLVHVGWEVHAEARAGLGYIDIRSVKNATNCCPHRDEVE
jgi:hypothetical protein